MKPLLVSSGEPAGIGPDLCLALAAYALPVVVMGDKDMLVSRAMQLGLRIHFDDYQAGVLPTQAVDHLTVLSVTSAKPVPAKSKAVP